jgi:hypothetical protein
VIVAMLLRDEDTAAFKKWLEPKLDKVYVQAAQAVAFRLNSDINSSDADAEVLADYVVALVTANETEGSIRENCVESLSDFLQDSTNNLSHELYGDNANGQQTHLPL